jgi:hypothetical protein
MNGQPALTFDEGNQVDATVRDMTQPSPWGSNQERKVRRHVALEPQIVASVRVRAVSSGTVVSMPRAASTVSIWWYCISPDSIASSHSDFDWTYPVMCVSVNSSARMLSSSATSPATIASHSGLMEGFNRLAVTVVSVAVPAP